LPPNTKIKLERESSLSSNYLTMYPGYQKISVNANIDTEIKEDKNIIPYMIYIDQNIEVVQKLLQKWYDKVVEEMNISISDLSYLVVQSQKFSYSVRVDYALMELSIIVFQMSIREGEDHKGNLVIILSEMLEKFKSLYANVNIYFSLEMLQNFFGIKQSVIKNELSKFGNWKPVQLSAFKERFKYLPTDIDFKPEIVYSRLNDLRAVTEGTTKKTKKYVFKDKPILEKPDSKIDITPKFDYQRHQFPPEPRSNKDEMWPYDDMTVNAMKTKNKTVRKKPLMMNNDKKAVNNNIKENDDEITKFVGELVKHKAIIDLVTKCKPLDIVKFFVVKYDIQPSDAEKFTQNIIKHVHDVHYEGIGPPAIETNMQYPIPKQVKKYSKEDDLFDPEDMEEVCEQDEMYQDDDLNKELNFEKNPNTGMSMTDLRNGLRIPGRRKGFMKR